jgi:hypothetical protein
MTADSPQMHSAQTPTDPSLSCRRRPVHPRLRRAATLALALLALAIAAAPAPAATTDQIVRDVRDGQVDGVYSQAALQAALASPLLKTYGGQNGVEAVQSALGEQTEAASGSGALPFTGFELLTFLILGSTLFVAGFALRRAPDEHLRIDV